MIIVCSPFIQLLNICITGSYGLVCIYANMYFILGRQRFNFGPFLFHLEMSNTFFFQNDSEWPKMDFKHDF